MVPLGPHRPWTGGGQTGAPALSHTLSPSRHSHLPGVTCPVHAPGPPRDSSGAAAEASSSGSGFWVPLAWSWQPPSTPTQSPTERGDGTCYLGPAEGTRPCPAPGLPGPLLTVPRTPPVPLPGELLRPHPHLDIEGCPSPAPELPTSLQTCRGVLPELPEGRKLIRGCTAGSRQRQDANSSLAGSSLCTSPLVTSLQATDRPCLKAGPLYPLEPKKKLKLLGHTGPQNTCSGVRQGGRRKKPVGGGITRRKEKQQSLHRKMEAKPGAGRRVWAQSSSRVPWILPNHTGGPRNTCAQGHAQGNRLCRRKKTPCVPGLPSPAAPGQLGAPQPGLPLQPPGVEEGVSPGKQGHQKEKKLINHQPGPPSLLSMHQGAFS